MSRHEGPYYAASEDVLNASVADVRHAPPPAANNFWKRVAIAAGAVAVCAIVALVVVMQVGPLAKTGVSSGNLQSGPAAAATTTAAAVEVSRTGPLDAHTTDEG